MSFTKVAPAGIGTEPGDGYRIGNSFLHAGGVQMGFGSTVGAINGITTYLLMQLQLNLIHHHRNRKQRR